MKLPQMKWHFSKLAYEAYMNTGASKYAVQPAFLWIDHKAGSIMMNGTYSKWRWKRGMRKFYTQKRRETKRGTVHLILDTFDVLDPREQLHRTMS